MDQRFKFLLGILAFGSVWGLLECVIGSMKLPGMLEHFPMGALLGGLIGFGLMAYTRRMYGQPGMQLAMGAVAGLLRFWSPVGTCILCSALAIMFESLVFECIYYWKMTSISTAKDRARLGVAAMVPLGVISGYVIYTLGYVFTQTATPILSAGAFTPSDLWNALPLIFGRGFFAAVFGGMALPLAALVNFPVKDIYKISARPYAVVMAVSAVVSWAAVITLSLSGFFG